MEVAPEPPSVVNPVTLSLKQAMKDKGRPHIKKLKSFGHCPNYLHFHRESMGNHWNWTFFTFSDTIWPLSLSPNFSNSNDHPSWDCVICMHWIQLCAACWVMLRPRKQQCKGRFYSDKSWNPFCPNIIGKLGKGSKTRVTGIVPPFPLIFSVSF